MSSVFEEKNNAKAILRIALPAMPGQLTTLIYNIADTYFAALTDNPGRLRRSSDIVSEPDRQRGCQRP